MVLSPLDNVRLTAVDQADHANRRDGIGLGVVAKLDLREVFGRLTADHLAMIFRIEH